MRTRSGIGAVRSAGSDRPTAVFIHHYSTTQSSFSALRLPHCSACPSLPLSSPLATTHFFTVSKVLRFPECHVFGILQYVVFSEWLLSLSDVHLRFLHRSILSSAP